MKPVVFLDIDGVLNSLRTALAFDELRTQEVDSAAVGLIERLVKLADADVVVSSSWRIGRTVDELRELFRDYFSADWWERVVDKTPSTGKKRGHDIEAWLDKNPRERYVILDDDSDMLAAQRPHFVNTTHTDGLQVKHYWKALKILCPEHNEVANLEPMVNFVKRILR